MIAIAGAPVLGQAEDDHRAHVAVIVAGGASAP